MTITPKPLGQGLVKALATVIYTVPPGILSATIRSMTAPNNALVMSHLTVWKVPPSTSPAAGHRLTHELEVPYRGLAWDDAIHVLETGWSIQAMCDADDDFTLTIDGSERT